MCDLTLTVKQMRKLKQMKNYVLVACSSEDKVPIGKQSSHFGG